MIGENQKHAGALIVPSFANLTEWYKKQNIEFNNNEEIIKHESTKKLIQDEIIKINNSLAQYETIKKFELLSREWSIEKGEMTPKLSLKRKVITEANKILIDKIYNL